MDIMSIVTAAAVIGVIGILVGVLLGISSEVFKVKVDEKEIQIREVLPGNNCGGCGYPGCDGLAAAIAKGEAACDACPVGGEAVAKVIAELVGGEISSTKLTAVVKCAGTCDKAKTAYDYVGPINCQIAANAPGGGPKSCSYGCLGFGSCVEVCQFDAIHIVEGVAVVDKEKCKACNQCVIACPRHLIKMTPYEAKVVIECESHDFGKDVKAVCGAGCIGCGICEKTCPVGAISMNNKLPEIDYSKCISCGACAAKCPTKIIKIGE